MIKLYLKQAYTLMKQHRLFTGIYVVGTGLSIALVMTMFIIFYVKFAPIYPEYNRDRTLVIKPVKRMPKGHPDNWNSNGGVSYYVVKEMLPGLPHLEAVGGVCPNFLGDDKVALPGKEVLPVNVLYADGGFWKVFAFRFLCGRHFTQEEAEAGAPVAVLSASLARRIFASTEVEGRHFMLNGKDCRVCGVVEDVSNATPETAADLWVPLFVAQFIDSKPDNVSLIGNVRTYLLAPTPGDKEALRKEVQELFKKHNLQNEKYEHDLMGQPDDYWVSTFRGMGEPDMKEIVKGFLYMLLALIFIPALNLSGMISSRMDNRLCELGVRKVYGATNSRLLSQVLCENLLLTCLGGLAGLLFSYLIVLTASDWILTLFDDRIREPGKNMTLTSEMLFNPAVFGIAFGLCLLLNLVSALIPTVWSLRRTIIQSLHTNR